jgi:hypothetical protein
MFEIVNNKNGQILNGYCDSFISYNEALIYLQSIVDKKYHKFYKIQEVIV